MKKILLTIILLMSLTACNEGSEDNNDPWISSSDDNQLRIDEAYIYVLNHLSENEIIDLLNFNSEDDFTVVILNNEGLVKSTSTIFDFDIIRISNSNNSDVYEFFIRVVSDFS